MQLRSFWRKYMRKSQYEIWTCVWSKKLDWDMHLVIYPLNKFRGYTQGETRNCIPKIAYRAKQIYKGILI